MIKVSVLYPQQQGGQFDMGYYLDRHVPMARQKLGAACRRVTVEKGLGGAAPDSAPAYAVMAHLYFESLDAFQAAFLPHVAAIEADVPNYTNLKPVVQISEVCVEEQ